MIKIGKHIQAMSAGNAVELIKKRYPKATKADIQQMKDTYFKEDKGAEKLKNGDTGSDTKES